MIEIFAFEGNIPMYNALSWGLVIDETKAWNPATGRELSLLYLRIDWGMKY